MRPRMRGHLCFETERARVRRLVMDDVDGMLSVYGDPRTMRFVGKTLKRAGCIKWVEATLENYDRYGYGMWVVESLELPELSPAADDDSLLGFCGLVHPGGQDEVELKYAYRPEVWGQGFATEVAESALMHGAIRLGKTDVIATADPENTASHRVLLKAGMKPAPARREADGSQTSVFRWSAGPIAERVDFLKRNP